MEKGSAKITDLGQMATAEDSCCAIVDAVEITRVVTLYPLTSANLYRETMIVV